MNKLAIIIVTLILAMAVGLGGCITVNPSAPVAPEAATPTAESEPLAQPEILDITITGYHSTRDIEGNYDPDHVEATLSWETNKPYYYCFEVRPVDFNYPTNSGGYEKFDVSVPLQEQVSHSRPIVLRSGKLHLYVLTVWDKEKNYITKSDTFWAPVVPKAPPPPAPAIAAPELISPHNGATGVELRPRFVWKAVPNAKTYELAVSRYSDFSDRVISVSMGDTAYQLPPDLRYYDTSEHWPSLTPSTQYYWMVAAKLNPADPNTTIVYSPVWTFTTAPPPAPAPTLITISPTTSQSSPGHVGTEITISGTGFRASSTITITYTSDPIVFTTTSGSDGSFSYTFEAPPSEGGAHTITATDGTSSMQVTFYMESTPPQIPPPLLPMMGDKADSQTHFDWEDVTDDSMPLTYTLQIASDANFAHILVNKTGLTTSEYTLTEEEALESTGKEEPYYWRVKATDAASNTSAWTGAGTFYVD